MELFVLLMVAGMYIMGYRTGHKMARQAAGRQARMLGYARRTDSGMYIWAEPHMTLPSGKPYSMRVDDANIGREVGE